MEKKIAAQTLDIIENQRLYCPAPNLLNDPFECQANISFDAPLEVKNERAKERLMKENFEMTETEAKQHATVRWTQVEEGGIKGALSWLYKDWGVISFSAIKDNILMWSHYAGSHNGICIEFRRCLDEKHANFGEHVNFFAQAHEVQYSQNLPTVNFYTTSRIEKIRALILTKLDQWSYEKEWRIIMPPDAISKSRYVPVPAGVITAIYLGCKITEENRDAVLQILQKTQNKGVRVFQAKQKSDAYGLYFEPISMSI
jgi:hypothetical protein